MMFMVTLSRDDSRVQILCPPPTAAPPAAIYKEMRRQRLQADPRTFTTILRSYNQARGDESPPRCSTLEDPLLLVLSRDRVVFRVSILD